MKRILDVYDMMLVAKYFNSNIDYINVMKVNKKYEELSEYHYSDPMYDCPLFNTIKTQYVYSENEEEVEESMEE